MKMPDFHVTFRDLLHAVNLRHGTDGFTSPPKEDWLRIFSPWKIQRLRSGLNPRSWVPKASTLPLDHRSRLAATLDNRVGKKGCRKFGFILGLPSTRELPRLSELLYKHLIRHMSDRAYLYGILKSRLLPSKCLRLLTDPPRCVNF